MQQVNLTRTRPSLNISIFSGSLWPLLLLASLASACSSNYNTPIQAVASEVQSPSMIPVHRINGQYENEKQNKIQTLNNFYNTPILIKAKRSQLNIHPSLANKTLLLGDSRIEYWPLALPACKKCNLEVKRRFYPNGPDTQLVLTNIDSTYQWGILQSSQKQSHLLGSKLYFDKQGQLNLSNSNNDSNKILLRTGKSYNMKNCTITPLWIENIKPLSSAYSDDQPKHKIQIFFECH